MKNITSTWRDGRNKYSLRVPAEVARKLSLKNGNCRFRWTETAHGFSLKLVTILKKVEVTP